MKILFSILLVSLILFNGCSDETVSTTSSELLGEWKLSKEIVNKKTLSYTDKPIKTILSFKEGDYFHLYDDVSDANLGDEIGNIQTHYKGQFTFKNERIQLNHEADGTEIQQQFDVQKLTEKELILVEKKHKRELHYSKL